MISKHQIRSIAELANEKIELILTSLGMDIDEMIMTPDEIRCRCPLHNGKNKTSFAYNLKFKNWRCFSQGCHEGGSSIFDLAKRILKCDFLASVNWIAKTIGYTILEGEIDEALSENDILVNNLIKESKIQHRVIKSTSKIPSIPIEQIRQNLKISEYFLKKGFQKNTLEKFMVGYCDNNTKPMYLRSFSPILDLEKKNAIGVTGRIIYEQCPICQEYHNPNSKGCPCDNSSVRAYAKWLHYGFKSSEVLYNMWNAYPYIKHSGVAIVCEGPKEVWFADQYSINNAVSCFGTSLHKSQINMLLHAGATTLIFALDNDEAGIEAMEKINASVANYFKVINIQHLLKPGQDLDDLSSEEINGLIPFFKSLEKQYV